MVDPITLSKVLANVSMCTHVWEIPVFPTLYINPWGLINSEVPSSIDPISILLQIKILKRHGDPKTASSGGHSSPSPSASAAAGSGSGSGSKHKSLAEREADYASARARILGSDYKPGGGAGTGESAGAATIAPVVNPSGGGGSISVSPRSEAGVKRQPRYDMMI